MAQTPDRESRWSARKEGPVLSRRTRVSPDRGAIRTQLLDSISSCAPGIMARDAEGLAFDLIWTSLRELNASPPSRPGWPRLDQNRVERGPSGAPRGAPSSERGS